MFTNTLLNSAPKTDELAQTLTSATQNFMASILPAGGPAPSSGSNATDITSNSTYLGVGLTIAAAAILICCCVCRRRRQQQAQQNEMAFQRLAGNVNNV